MRLPKTLGVVVRGFALAALLTNSTFAQQQTRSALITELSGDVFQNGRGAITGQNLYLLLSDVTNSMAVLAGPNTWTANQTIGSLTVPAQTSLTINNSVNTPPNTNTGSYGLQVGTFVTASVPRGSSADFYTAGAFGTIANVNEGGVQTTLAAPLLTSVPAGSFVVGQRYGVLTLGNTDFTLIGDTQSPSPGAVGDIFVATGVGNPATTGTAGDAQVTVTSPTGILGGDGLRLILNDGKFWFYHLNVVGTAGVQVSNPVPIDHGAVFGINAGTVVYDNKGVATTWNTDVELEPGASNWYGAISGAVGVINQEPGTYIVCGVCVEAEHNHLFQGVAIDTAFGVSNQSGAEPEFRSILSINGEEGRMPVGPSTTILISQGFASVKSFIDFSSMGCSAFEINFVGFSVDCAGTPTTLNFKHTGNEFDQSTVRVIPTTGATVNIANGTETEIIGAAGTLATLNLNLPSCNGPNNGYPVRFETEQPVTALTLGAALGTVNVGFTSLPANAFHSYYCYASVWRLIF